MFGNRYVNYGGPGGVRRGLIWQSSNVGGADPCDIAVDWGEWINPGYFDVRALIRLTFQALKYDVYKERYERRDPSMNEERFIQLRDSVMNTALDYFDQWHDGSFDGIANVVVHCQQEQPLITWVYWFPWTILVMKNKYINGYYDTINGHRPNNANGIRVKPMDAANNYEWEWITHRPGGGGAWPIFDHGTEVSSSESASIDYLTGYNGGGRFAQMYYESHIPNCVVSPCPISHWIGNNVDIHY